MRAVHRATAMFDQRKTLHIFAFDPWRPLFLLGISCCRWLRTWMTPATQVLAHRSGDALFKAPTPWHPKAREIAGRHS